MPDTDNSTPCGNPVAAAPATVPDALTAAPGGPAPMPWTKCVDCPELGRTCNGYDIAALGSVEAVRTYHKSIRTARHFTEAQIVRLVEKRIGSGTVHDYFLRGPIDPKWQTVAAIDCALVTLCGDRAGQPPLEIPCPATFATLRERCDSLSARLDEAAAENARLAEALAAAEENAKTRLTDQRADLDQIIKLQQARIAALEAEKKDYLDRNDRKRAELEAARSEIRDLNRTNLQITREFAAKMLDMYDKLLALSGG